MQNNKVNQLSSDLQNSYCNIELNNILLFDDLSSEIRLGIIMADEKAKQETTKRKIQAPITTEEKILLECTK